MERLVTAAIRTAESHLRWEMFMMDRIASNLAQRGACLPEG
jgi:hypothetical protein